jgi:protein-S-isoprenylcysteine O-methyltransferase Ste14
MFITIRLFIQIGKGTLAPWEPTKKLVAAGIYRHTRNPMITGVTAILLGETVATGSAGLLVWAVLFFILNTVYFKLSEEPGLEARFGDDYVEYRKNVPMWLPRIKPWDHE